jgi:TMEM175 potassium channel family protein
MIYGINIAIAGSWAAVQWSYATKEHRLVDADLDPNFITIMSRRGVTGIIVYLIAAALLFASTTVSLVLFIVIPVYYLIPARTDKSWLWFTRNK